MTITEVRNHKEYELCFNKIKAYKKGFEFTVHYNLMPSPQANALKIVMHDAVQQGYLECTETLLSLDCEITAETFIKL